MRTMTHYAAIHAAMPVNKVVRVHLKHTLKGFPGAKGESGVSHSALYIPPKAATRTALRSAEMPHHVGPIEYVTTAETFLFHHPDVITDNPDLAAPIVTGYMENDKNISVAINNLATQMRQMGPPTETSGWARLLPFTPNNPDAGFDGKKTYYQQQPTPQLSTNALPALGPLLGAMKNDPTFQGTKWSVQPGQRVVSQSGAAELALAAQISARAEGDYWQAALAVNDAVHGLPTSIRVVDANKKQLKASMANTFIRYLGAYIRFFDAGGNAMKVPQWEPDDSEFAKVVAETLDLQYDDLRYLGQIQPVNSSIGVPIFSDPATLDVTITFPPNPVSAGIYGSGLGIVANDWPKTPVIGGVLTGSFT